MVLPQLNIIDTKNNLTEVLNINTTNYDSLVILFSEKSKLPKVIPSLQHYLELDQSFGKTIQVICPQDQKPFSRLLLVPTGSISSDIDDARRFKDAAFEGGKRALEAGFVKPLICFADPPTPESQPSLNWTFDEQTNDYQHYLEVTMLGFLEAAYEPIDVRDYHAKKNTSIKNFEQLGFVVDSLQQDTITLIQKVEAIEQGRRVAKDIGSPDPEQMSPIQIVKYLESTFKNANNIKMTVIDDIDTIKKEYPLAHAVSRASLVVPRHHPRFVHFEYKSSDQSNVKENLYFVGKGVTYDTGGADIKCSGHMRGMSRDKCGAAAVAGLFKTIELLQPKGVNVTAGLALVRNSIGPDAYVSDEIICSRNGNRVLVGNTDAEGRMVMTDLLCEFKEKAIAHAKSQEPSGNKPSLLFTVATLTGHALRAYGGYGITMDNGYARKNRVSRRIYDAGHILADPFEISTLRREDVDVVQPGRSSEDVVQANDKASTMTDRGHQYPAGFMLIASGLEDHGLRSDLPIGYSHLDVAGSAETMSSVGWSLTRVTGSPVAALTGAFLL
ncbi:uncharacterized protein BX664DRAFT_287936 [Halteromyces radiatus]|uniref:uncharacterized protein n=1 Tax=Halteromyces radiatus TaxID=101107 RepID=UPI00221E41B7|nr:uncharacterized protein BX664DRAFT_287936 [Halteromyces radiatus]KAI8098450.1 hypothetical protein BX664DRAFT_287936 [Halteromyces radiatus]